MRYRPDWGSTTFAITELRVGASDDTAASTESAMSPDRCGPRSHPSRPRVCASWSTPGSSLPAQYRSLSGLPTEQTSEALSGKALTPPIDERIIAGELVADLGPCEAAWSKKDGPRAARLFCSACLTGRSLIDSCPFHTDKTIVLLMRTIFPFLLLQSTRV
jgi:hypothetical protein